MRSCKNCVKENKWCRFVEESKKCVKCVKSAMSYDLTSFNIFKWQCLENYKRKLKIKLREACVKQQRLLRQIDSLKNKQKKMINVELQNIEKLKKQKFETLLSFDFLIDVASEQIALFIVSDEWFLIFLVDETSLIVSDSQSSSWIIFKYCRMWVIFSLDEIFLIFSI